MKTKNKREDNSNLRSNRTFFNKKEKKNVYVASIFVISLLFGMLALTFNSAYVIAHEGTGDVYVRVVSADPDTRTYTFSCRMDPENNLLRDWFIRQDTGTTQGIPNEAEILDQTGKTVTYTFQQNGFYHIGCLVYNDQTAELSRGDLHIDLRAGNTWDPEIIPVSGNGLSSTLNCEYSGPNTNLNWQVIDARTGAFSNIGTSNPLTHTVPGHGLYDYICNINGLSTALHIEYFDAGDPYFPDEYGVPDGVYNTRDGSPPPATTVEAQPPIPTVSLSVTGSNEAGWNLVMTTTNFQFYMPPGEMGPHVNGQGHAHWYLDGVKQGRLYQASNIVSSFPQGQHQIKVVLSSNDHKEYTYNGNLIQATANINVVSGGSGNTHTNIQNIPATCEGGTITSDIYNGGRDITCTTSGKSLRIQAWDKPDGQTPQYFEMYKVSESPENSGLKICLGTTCISDNGWAKSPNYPITVSGGTTTPPPTNDTTTPPPTNTSGTTYNNIQNIPATCEGGTIISDTYNGGRDITCTTSGKSLRIAAWDKPDGSTPQYFEMYKLSEFPAGSGLKICLGTTCISDNGWAKSPNYPITVSGGTTTPPPTNDTTTPPPTNTSGTTYNNIQNIPAACEGGTITSDTYNGGRDITCTTSGKSLRIQAWDKPDGSTPQYFEMYKLSEFPAGSGLKICLGTTCISDNGWAKSPNYPIIISGSGTGSGGGGTGVAPPLWFSTFDEVVPTYFHLEMQEPADTSQIASTDYEIWNTAYTDKVWSLYNAMGSFLFHVHTPDGTFGGSHSGQTQLNYGTTYYARARFKLLDGTYTAWSQKTIYTLSNNGGGSSTTWTAASGFKVDVVATGLDYPVQIASAPSGMYDSLPDNVEPMMYVTELYGKIKVIHKDGSQSVYAQDLLNFDPFGSITGGGQMGLIGLYVDDATGDLFAGMTYVEGGNTIKNKVVRFYSTNDGNSFTSSQTIISNLPSSASHQVEQITKGPDGKLYVNLGDALVSSNAQSDSILAGKIIRMNMDGSNVEVYAKGFRNPFGADWRPGFNVLYATDNGPDSGDRVVKVLQGDNYGWGMNDNFATWNSKVLFFTDVSPVDLEFNPGGKGFPSELTGKLYVAVAGPIYSSGPTANGKVIWELTLDNNGNVASSRQFLKYSGSGYGTPMGLDFGQDGLYFTDIYGEAGASGFGSEGRVLKITQGTPSGGGGTSGPFRTNIFISPWFPKLIGSNVEYEFTCNPIDGSGNYKYDWSFGDGQQLINHDWNKKLHTYPYTNQQYTVTCVAKDQSTGQGQSASASMTVNPIDYLDET
jgi:glucose/arabinose dehydrogenase